MSVMAAHQRRSIGDRVEVALDEVWRGPDALHADRRLASPQLDLARDASQAHQPLHALSAQRQTILHLELGVHARRPVGLKGLLVDLEDPLGQDLVGERPRRGRRACQA